VIPTDRTFTTVDILAGLEALDPGRVWRKRLIDGHVSRLRDRGIVRRIRKSKKSEPAIYACVGVNVGSEPFEDMRIEDVVSQVLEDGPMRQSESIVETLERGYQIRMKRQHFSAHIGRVLRGNSDMFKLSADRWLCLGSSHGHPENPQCQFSCRICR